MKLPGVSGVFDYAGPNRDSRYRPCSCGLPPVRKRRRPDCLFSELNTQPTCTPVYASPCTSRYTAQNSGPSGSLLLSRRTLSFPASCRFIPAHQTVQSTHYQRSPCFGMRFVAGAGCRGFAPAPPGFIAWCLSRCWARCRKRMKKGDAEASPLIDRSRPLSRRSGCLPALPYPPLSSGSFYWRRDKELASCGEF